MARSETITDRALLVKITIKRFSGQKTNKQVTKAIAMANGSDEKMGRYSQKLLPQEALDELRVLDQNIRADYHKHTLAWMDDGIRILASTGYFDFAKLMRDYLDQWEKAVEKFAQNYPDYQLEAQRLLGRLYDPAMYPAHSDIKSSFTFEWAFFPLPDGEDFRVDLGGAETERLKKQISDATRAAVEQGMKAKMEEVMEIVARMVERLKSYKVKDDGKVEGIFRDSLVSNVADMVRLLPTLNPTDDPQLHELAGQMERDLLQFSPQQLREDSDARKQTADKAEEILKKMEGVIA